MQCWTRWSNNPNTASGNPLVLGSSPPALPQRLLSRPVELGPGCAGPSPDPPVGTSASPPIGTQSGSGDPRRTADAIGVLSAPWIRRALVVGPDRAVGGCNTIDARLCWSAVCAASGGFAPLRVCRSLQEGADSSARLSPSCHGVLGQSELMLTTERVESAWSLVRGSRTRTAAYSPHSMARASCPQLRLLVAWPGWTR